MEQKISIVIPVYNEEKGIADTILNIQENIKKINEVFEILVVNDGSIDKTGEILNNFAGVKVINHPFNKGYGASLKTGIRNSNFDKILIVDADATYPIDKISELVKYSRKYEMVIAARIGEKVHMPFFRKIGKKIVGLFANFALGKRIPDINSGFRIFDKKIVLENFHLFPSGFSFTTTLTMIFLINDYNVKFVSINYFKRTGKSSIKPLKDFFGFLILITKIVMYYNPLKFFLLPGIIFFMVGIIYFFRNLILFKDIPDGSIFLILFGIQIVFTGFLADILATKRRER